MIPKKNNSQRRQALYDMMNRGGMLPRRKTTSRQTLRPGMEYDYMNPKNREDLLRQGFKFRTTPQGKTVAITPEGDKAVYKDRGELGTELKFKQRMALGGLVRKYQNGGVEGDPPMTAEQLRAMRNALLVGSADEMPQAEDFVTAGQGSSTSVAMPTRGPGEPLEPIRDPEPERQPERPEDLEPLTPLGIRTIKTGDKKELQGSPSEMPKRYEDKFISFTLDNTMRTEQLPRAKEVYNPETRQYEERPLELEELADYIFRNQRKLRNLRYPTLEDAASKAEEILSRPNAGRL